MTPRAALRSSAELVRSARQALTRLGRRYVYRHQLRLITWLRHGRAHAAPIDPFTNLSVDPAAIESWIDFDRADFMRIRFDFGVRGGDWDLDTKPLSEHFVFASIDAHFNKGVPWEDTPIYAVAQAGIVARDWRYHGCRTTTEIVDRLAQLDALYERVRRDGYRTQRELQVADGEQPLHRRRHRPPEIDEVIVSIGRDGTFIFIDGIHRLSVAKVARVPSLPVCVLTRHAAWQDVRDRVARAPHSFPASVLAHPDLAGLGRRGAGPKVRDSS